MPLGEYEDFDACVAAQKEKGHDMESAQKICGEIQKRIEGASKFRFENLGQEIVSHEANIWPMVLNVEQDELSIYVHDVIGPGINGDGVTSLDLVPAIEAAGKRNCKRLRMNINSIGGSVAHAMSIFNAMQAFPGEKIVDITGQAASAGAIMATAGDRIRIHENATMLLHPAMLSLLGANEQLLLFAVDSTRKATDQIIDLLSIRSGQSKDTIRELVNANGYNGTMLTGTEAVSYGLADELVPVKPKKDRMMAALLEIAHENAVAQAQLIRNRLSAALTN